MTGAEAVDWLASARLDPDEDDRADVRHALLLDALVRVLTPQKRGQRYRGPTATDFLASLPWRPEHAPTRPATPQELVLKINAAMQALGGRKRGTTDAR